MRQRWCIGRRLLVQLRANNHQETSNSFGPTTYSLCPTIAQWSEGNLVYIVQGGFWCKGYNQDIMEMEHIMQSNN